MWKRTFTRCARANMSWLKMEMNLNYMAMRIHPT